MPTAVIDRFRNSIVGIRTSVTPPKTWRALRPGDVLNDRYVVEGELGRGGMGSVHLAYDKELDERVALKFVIDENPKGFERMKREIRIARKVSHPNVVRIHDVADFEGHPFLTMEYLQGRPLSAILAEQERLEIDPGIRLAIEICAGVNAAHEVNLIHRDLKPHNIMVTAEGHAKVLDFGLAKSQENIGITVTGAQIGTVGYMSPEQARGDKSIDTRSDIFSIGVILYEMFTGHRPFAGPSTMEILTALANEEPRRPRTLQPQLPEALDTVVMRCLAKDPAKRFQTALDLKTALHAIQQR